MLSKLALTLAVLLVAGVAVVRVSAVCGACNANNAIACLSETKFQWCVNGERDRSETLECPEGTVCTDLRKGCVDNSTTPLCQASGCGECDGKKMFTCISKTSFVQCNNTELMPESRGNCPPDLICDSSTNEICLPECKINGNYECTD